MKISHIDFPYAFTAEGDRILLETVIGTPRVGSELVPEGDKLRISAVTNDSECVGGVCPVK